MTKELEFLCLVTSLLYLCVRLYMVSIDSDTPSICIRGQFVTGGKILWGAFCMRDILFLGIFILVGFLTGGLRSGGFFFPWLFVGGS